MDKGRRTTFEERVNAARDCIERGKDYRATAELHQVSHHQIRSWVRKYEQDGPDALVDRRGKRKSEAEMTLDEKRGLEKKRSKREKERLCAEIAFRERLEAARENRVSSVAKYEAIQAFQYEKLLSVGRLCTIAGVSRAAYYKWTKRVPHKQEIENAAIVEEMKIIHEQVGGTYGYRRVGMELKRQFGRTINHKRVRRLMHSAGLKGTRWGRNS